MKKKASILVLTGAVTISNIGLTTTSFAEVRDENLLTQEISTKIQNKVVIEKDGTVIVAGEDAQIGTADDITIKPGKNGQVPHVDQFGNVTVPTGGYVSMPNGTIVTDTGNDHSIIVPGGTVITPNGNGGVPTVNQDGSVNVPDGSMVVLPNGDYMTPQDGSVVSGDGSINVADGSVINPDGGVTNSGGSVTNSDKNVVNQDVNTENPKTGDTSMMGTLVLGSMALLGLIKNRKNKK